MSDNETVLIVCRSPGEFDLAARVPRMAGLRYIVASDDVRVHLRALQTGLDGFTWLEDMTSFYEVADDVLRILESVNLWLGSLDVAGLPKHLLCWLPHVEGGMTTQRIQDALILIRSYGSLLIRERVRRVVIVAQPGMAWADSVLEQVARSLDIEVAVLGGLGVRCLYANTKAALKKYAKELYFNLSILMVWIRTGKKRNGVVLSRGNDVVFQLCTPGSKHTGNIVPLMEALERRRCSPVALCWGAGGAPRTIRARGLKAEELENWLSVYDLVMAFVATLRVWRTARRREFTACPGLEFEGVPLGHILWPSIRYFVVAEVGRNLRLFAAARKYFTRHPAKALKAWGGVEMMEGRIAWECLRSVRPALIFNYWLGPGKDDPYAPRHFHYDLFLASGAVQKQLLERLGVPPDTIALVGQGRYDEITRFQETYSREASRLHLQVSPGCSAYILLDSGTAFRGYLSNREYGLAITAILDFAKNHPSAAIIIKPHPTHRAGYLEALLAHYRLSNVFAVDKGMLPYHAINAADIVVTKYSTMGIEAMLFARPVISLILDGERRFRIFGEAAEYVETTDEFDRLLTELVNDRAAWTKWRAEQLHNQARFLKEYFTKSEDSASETAARVIDEFVRRETCGAGVGQ